MDLYELPEKKKLSRSPNWHGVGMRNDPLLISKTS